MRCAQPALDEGAVREQQVVHERAARVVVVHVVGHVVRPALVRALGGEHVVDGGQHVPPARNIYSARPRRGHQLITSPPGSVLPLDIIGVAPLLGLVAGFVPGIPG